MAPQVMGPIYGHVRYLSWQERAVFTERLGG